jgi:multidrug resistance efflux pump
VSGYITEVRFEEGAIIKKDDLLYVIDPRPYQADFDRAAAEFERMQAQLKLSQIELDRAQDLRRRGSADISIPLPSRSMPVGYAEGRNVVFHKVDIVAASLGHENPI